MGRVIRKFRGNHIQTHRRHLNTVSGKTRVLDAVYNASDSDLVGTNTLVQVDAAPFKKNNEVTGEFKNLESDQIDGADESESDGQRDQIKVNDEAFAEVDKIRKIAENAREELRAAQVTNAELEADLRRLNIQCDLSIREQEIKDTI